MASSFSEGERVRLFTLSLPESFQFFSVGACSHWLVLLDGSTGDVFASGLSWSPMSDMGQNAKCSPGVNDFRIASNNGYRQSSRTLLSK